MLTQTHSQFSPLTTNIAVRRQLLDEDEAIAEAMAELETVSTASDDAESLCERLKEAIDRVEAHFSFEERALCPLLHRIPRGDDLVEWLRYEHSQHRQILRAAQRLLQKDADLTELRAVAGSLIDEMSIHIALEEAFFRKPVAEGLRQQAQ